MGILQQNTIPLFNRSPIQGINAEPRYYLSKIYMNYFRDGVYSANYDMPSLSKNFSMLSGDFIFRFTYPDRITDKIGNIYAKTEVKC